MPQRYWIIKDSWLSVYNGAYGALVLPLFVGVREPYKRLSGSYFKQGPGPRYAEKAVIHAKWTDPTMPTIVGESVSHDHYNTVFSLSVVDNESAVKHYLYWKAFNGYTVAVGAEQVRGMIPIGQFYPEYYYVPITIQVWKYQESMNKWVYGYNSYTTWRLDTGQVSGCPELFGDNLGKQDRKTLTLDKIAEVLQPQLDRTAELGAAKLGAWWDANAISLYNIKQPVYPAPLESAFIAGEPDMFREVGEVGLAPSWPDGSRGGFNRGILTQSAVYNAFQSMPKMSDNSISNAIEAVSTIAMLREGYSPTRFNKKAVQDTWLQYRYAYNTSIMDVNEIGNYLDRKLNLSERTSYVVRGTSHYTYCGIPMTCRVKFSVKNRKFSAIRDAWAWAQQYGLQPNLYTAWDMTPYSFVVDWFLPVGDLLSTLDAQQFLDRDNYDVGPATYSISYTRTDLPGKPHCYTRWVGGMPSFLIGATFQDHEVSGKTRLKRLADAWSLFL